MTLQSAYFQDWGGNPTVLLWGDAAAMRDLTDFLRKIQIAPEPFAFSDFCKAVDGKEIAVSMVADRRSSGMRLSHDGQLEWKMRPQEADDFADKVNVLTLSAGGHLYLDCYDYDSITVTVSTGEYPDCLHPDRPSGLLGVPEKRRWRDGTAAKTYERKDGKARVYIVRRDDGLFQFQEEHECIERGGPHDGEPYWISDRSGFYDSVENAETAAINSISWLKEDMLTKK